MALNAAQPVLHVLVPVNDRAPCDHPRQADEINAHTGHPRVRQRLKQKCHLPGIPVLAPGELVNDAIIEYLQRLAAEGVMVGGPTDESLANLAWSQPDRRLGHTPVTGPAPRSPTSGRLFPKARSGPATVPPRLPLS